MADSPTVPILVPLGDHFFSPDALKKAVESALEEHPGKQNILKGTVDNAGVSVVLGMQGIAGPDGQVEWKLQTAFAHDWTKGNMFGAAGSVAW